MDQTPPPLPPAAAAPGTIPPAIPLQVPVVPRPAGFWIRVVASIIDTIVVVILTLPLLFAIYGGEYFTSAELIKGPADFLISYVLPAILIILLWITCKGTPGKLILGLHVVDAKTGEKLDLLQGVIRYLGYFVSIIPLFLGLLWVAWDGRKQGWHDKLAGSLVIWKNR